ncbi:hypothetical protein pW4_61 [Bacillus phage pW4]|uniref:Uncharacterized protein n=1 Tax=Bacillus phage pW4 TaxID=2500560 RepID=A0A3Q9R7U4_9CAUD|nr:hypothetical protein PP656_gp074 [Bacillus phage pW4]AZU99080.1 hypothetical protein pW4_61 [Bacillus phage pW4]
MENKVTFTKTELLILIGGVAAIWDEKSGNLEGYDKTLDERIEKIFNAELVEDEKTGKVETVDPNVDKEIEEDETYAKLIHKIADIYEGGVE